MTMTTVVPRLVFRSASRSRTSSLVRDVQVGGWLVQQHDRGVLRQGHGDPCSLALPARERVQGTVGEFLQAGGGQRAVHDVAVLTGLARQEAAVRVPAELAETPHRDPFGRDGLLRQHGDGPRDAASRDVTQVRPVEEHLPAQRLERVAERAKQGGLATSVGADERGDLPGRDLQVDVFEDRGARAVSDCEAASLR